MGTLVGERQGVSGHAKVVLGVGHPQARLCLLGEAPGAEEDRLGEPFVGRSGKLLDKILEACGLNRDKVYILNVLKCRPPGNRNPDPFEVARCLQYLFAQLDIIQPDVVCCLGAVAAQTLLANKEPLVMVGELILREARAAGATLLPIDSEHNAIFQCLPAGGDSRLGVAPAGVRRLLLTGSGGPFRNRALAELAHVTPAQACAHPNWRMGRKISVDSATMMNKGLELIEACRLFNIASDKIQIVVHPQSIIHSMVEYVDGSILAQLGQPDMRTPIAHALGWPERIDAGVKRLNLFDVARLDFEPPDLDRFPCLRLAQQAARAGGTTPAILNAANEVAVAAFLAGTLPFIEIARVIDQVLEALPGTPADTLEQVLDADGQARRTAQRMMGSASGSTAGGGR